MAAPTGNVKVYPNIQHVTTSSQGAVSSFLRDFMAFLLNDQTAFPSSAWVAGTGGPGWSIVESYSSLASSSSRETPSVTTGNGALASHSNSNNGWRPSNPTLAVGDWMVLQTSGPNALQIYFEFQSTTVLYYKMMPYAGFTTDPGSPISPPTGDFPSTGVPGLGADTFMSQTVFDAPTRYRAVAADRFFAVMADPGDYTGVTFEYMGEVVGAASLDTRPYVAYEATANCRFDIITASQWNRISPIDGATELTAGSNTQFHNVASIADRVHRYAESGTATDGTRMLPVGVFFDDAYHNHFAGWLVGVCSSNTDQGAVGGVNNATRGDDTGDGVGPNSGGEHNYAFRCDSASGTPPGIAFYWDGETEVP